MVDDRSLEVMAELLTEAHQMRVDDNERLDKTNERLDTTNERLDRPETQTAENNAAIGKLRISVLRLVDKIEEIYHLDQRVRVLENIVLPKPPLQAA